MARAFAVCWARGESRRVGVVAGAGRHGCARDGIRRPWTGRGTTSVDHAPRTGHMNDETKMQNLSYNLGILLTPYLHASSASKADSHHEAPAVHGDAVAERRRLAPRARLVNPDDLDDCKRRQVVSVLHAGVPVAADERVEA